ncbi:glycerophosphodiester phosphodiesterase, partial [Sinorhizobium medicae]
MKKIAAVALVVVAILWLLNTSLLATPPSGGAKILAHRGVHQVFNSEGLD